MPAKVHIAQVSFTLALIMALATIPNYYFQFLSDPGKPGARSLGPGVRLSVSECLRDDETLLM